MSNQTFTNKVKRKNLKIISFLLVIAVLVTMVPITSNAGSNNLTDKVTFGDVELYHENQLYSKNGSYVNNPPANIQVGDELALKIAWSISGENIANFTKDTYMEFTLPSYFTFTQTMDKSIPANATVDGVQKEIGKMTIVKNADDTWQIRITFIDLSEEVAVTDGYASFSGKASKKSDSETKINIGEKELPVGIITEKPSGFDLGDLQGLTLDKFGYNASSINGKSSWTIKVNMDNYKNTILGNSNNVSDLKNIFIVDELPDRLVFEKTNSISVTIPYYLVYEDSNGNPKLSNIAFAQQDISSVFGTPVTPNDHETWEEFKDRIKNADKPTYGFYGNNKLAIKVGDILKTAADSDLKSETWTELDNRINNMEKNIGSLMTTTQKQYVVDHKTELVNYAEEYYANLFADPSAPSGEGNPIGFHIKFSTLGSGENRKVTNTAIMYHDDEVESATSGEVQVSNADVGAALAPWDTVKLIKKSKDSGEVISGAAFTLYKYNKATNTTIGAVGTKYTDKDGVVEFTKLPSGTYQFVETDWATGYKEEQPIIKDASDNIVTDGVFSINASLKEGFTFEAFNEAKRGSLELTKTDADNNENLTGGEFGILKDGDSQYYATASAVDGKVIFDELEWGSYEIKEIKAPVGYDKDELVFDSSNGKFDITSTALKAEVSATNGRLLGQLSIEKYDSKNTDKALSGAVFSLGKLNESTGIYEDYTENGATVYATTDANGKAEFTNLPWGKYKVIEFKTPDGYTKDTLTYANGFDGIFTVGPENQATSIIAYNDVEVVKEVGNVLGEESHDDEADLNDVTEQEKGAVKGQEAKTNDNINMMLVLSLLVIALIALVVLLKKRQLNDN